MFKLIFKLAGWKVTHYKPESLRKCVIIVAPHTSNWDFIFGMGTVRIMGIHPRFAIKKEWIRFPFKRMMLRLGALPVDRGQKNAKGEKKGTVDAMAEMFDQREDLLLVITPEGTRKKVQKWKTGFYHVAMKANVPIALAFIDYKTKSCGIATILYPSGNFQEDMKTILDFYRPLGAKNPENFTVDIDLSPTI